MNRRNFLEVGAAAAVILSRQETASAAETLPFEKGKYQTFPRLHVNFGGERKRVLQDIDLGTLGPDVDTIAGMDFEGDIPTMALVVHAPEGKVLETRVVFIKRTDLETVQLRDVIGGDRFDVQKISQYGGDPELDKMARTHAKNTARRHQKVIYIGDLGLFENQWGKNETQLLQRMIRAQRPGKLELGLPDPNFVEDRDYYPQANPITNPTMEYTAE